jgi:thiol-disulfide isomerase/thioredoxin
LAREEKIPSIRAFVLIGVAEGMLKWKETGKPSGAPRKLVSVPTPKDVRAQPALPPPRHDREYQALWEEFNAEKESDVSKVAAAYAPRFLRLAQKYPDEPLAFDALQWIVDFAHETPEARTALEILLREHVRDRRMSRVCGVSIFSSFPKAAETLLRAVLEKNPDRRVQGCACLNLAQMLQARSQRIQALRRVASPKLARHYEAVFGKDYLNALQSSDPSEVLHETEKIYERVLEKYADVKVNDILLSEYAKRALFEIRNLIIGKPAPEIEGEDLDGKRFKLSDYRGQVVMLVFCGHWCSACRSLYPRERAFVKKMEGRPFVLLEVNSDEDRDKAKKTREKEKLGWRAWWDGGTAGPISQHWNVSSWPTIYVLDANGVIRFKDLVEDMEGMVDGLLKEQAAKRAK